MADITPTHNVRNWFAKLQATSPSARSNQELQVPDSQLSAGTQATYQKKASALKELISDI